MVYKYRSWRSLKKRIAIIFGIFVFCFVVIGNAAIYVVFLENSKKFIDANLYTEARTIISLLREDELFSFSDTSRQIYVEDVPEVIERSKNEGYIILIQTHDFQPYLRTSRNEIEFKGKVWYFDYTADGVVYRFYGVVYNNLYFYVWTSKEKILAITSELLAILVFIGVGVLGLSFLFAYYIVKRSLRPLQSFVDTIHLVDVNNPKIQLSSIYKTHDEIWDLAKTFDFFVAQLAAVLQREKEISQDVSHELRTPLTVIKTSLELVAKHPQSFINKYPIILSGIQKMEKLIDDMLFLSRYNITKPTEIIDIIDFLSDILPIYQFKAQEKNLQLILRTHTKTIQVHADEWSLERVFGNLIDNAIKYSNQWTISIDVFADRIEIRDQWIGIPHEQLEKIWQRFYRIDKARTSWAWVWLGLSIVKKVCDWYGWIIDIHSEQASWTKIMIRNIINKKK